MCAPRSSLFLAAILLFVCGLRLHAQLPAQSGAWQLRENGKEGQGRYTFPSGTDAERVAGFGGKHVYWGSYVKGREEVAVLLVDVESRERAFGLFTAAAATASMRHGIIGDAFAIENGIRHVNYGPFYLYFRASGRGMVIPEDLVKGITRVLFMMADCYGSDIPMRLDGRILGSERYVPPDADAWSSVQITGLEPVRDVVRGRSAWIARYNFRQSDPGRWVVSLPVRQKDALKALEAGIIDRYASEGKAIAGCTLAAFVYKATRVIILPSRAGLVIVLTSISDAGGCEWARSFATE